MRITALIRFDVLTGLIIRAPTLFREMNRIDKCHDAQAIIVGTYSIAGNRAFLSTRLVSTLDNSILSSYNFSIRMGDLLKTLAEKNLSSAAESKKPEEISDKGPLPSWVV